MVSASDSQSGGCGPWVPLWPHAGCFPGRCEFKSLATFVNSQLVASCQLGLNFNLVTRNTQTLLYNKTCSEAVLKVKFLKLIH